MSNSSSPFFTGAIVYGQYNPNHTSTAAIVYSPQTVPTPWPVLVVGVGIAVLTFLYAVISNANGLTYSKWPVELLFAAINTARAGSAFVLACKLLAGHAGHWSPPSAILTLLLSILPYIFSSCPPFNLVALIDTLLAFTALGIVTFLPWAHKSNPHYGTLQLEGGICPWVLGWGKNCPSRSEWAKRMPTAGCGGYLPSPENRFDLVGELRILPAAEKYMGTLMFVPLVLLGPAVILLAPAFLVQPVTDFDETAEGNDKRRKKVGWILVIKAILLLGVGGISILFHLPSIGNQVSVYSVVDSFGPVRNLTTDGAGGSWSDCFYVSSPSDKLGFLGPWWEKMKARPEQVLASM